VQDGGGQGVGEIGGMLGRDAAASFRVALVRWVGPTGAIVDEDVG
jgi:hypothetical protein